MKKILQNVILMNIRIYIILFLFISPVLASETTVYLGSIEKTIETGEIKVYIPAGNATVMKVKNQVRYIYADHLGSTALTTDEQGEKTESYLYYPYGNPSTPSAMLRINPLRINSQTDKLYTGQRKDESSDLYFYNARYYNPTIGNFISADKAQGPNRYSYVGNNPIMRNDPSGNDVNNPGRSGYTESEKDELIYDKFLIHSSDFLYYMPSNTLLNSLFRYAHLIPAIPIMARLGAGGQSLKIDNQDVQSEEWKNLRSKIITDVNRNLFPKRDQDLNYQDFLQAAASAINRNMTYNDTVGKVYQKQNYSRQDLFVARRESNYSKEGSLPQRLNNKSSLCFDFAGVGNLFLGELGIQSYLTGSDEIDHFFLIIPTKNEKKIVFDPTRGITTDLDNYKKNVQKKDFTMVGPQSLWSSFGLYHGVYRPDLPANIN